MLRKFLVGIVGAGLVLSLWACSDDDEPQPDTNGVIDAAVETGPEEDGAPGDAEQPQEAGGDLAIEGGAETDAQGTQYYAQVSAAEAVGRPTWGPEPDAGGDQVRLLSLEVSFNDPDKTTPDFIDNPLPPNCVGFKWTATTPPNMSAADGGKVTVTGHPEVVYVDGDNPGTPQPLPKTIECTRTQIGSSGLYTYNCGLPDNTVLPVNPWLSDTTELDIAAAGGADIPAFSETGLKAAPRVVPKASFDLASIDPAAIKAEWEATTAPLVAIDILAQLSDGSEFARITCTTLGVVGSKQIPADALKLMPTPTATEQLIIQTTLVGVNVSGSPSTWGSYNIGVGRGTFGVSCRTPAGACPAPTP